MAPEEEAVDFSEGDSLVVDFDNVEETVFEALPRGIYPCTIAECEFTYSQSGGNPMWTLQLEVSEGEYAGRILYSHLVFAGKGLGFTKRQLNRIAPDLIAKPFDVQDVEVISQMLGRNLKAKVTTRMYEEQLTNNVRDLLAADGDSFV
jgi:hypothetical protein